MGPGGADEWSASSDYVGMAPTLVDPDSRQWVERLRAGHPRYEPTVARLHEVLQRVATHELSRRRRQLRSISGPEFDDLAQQAADDALVNVLERLDEFRGLSRFTTWAYKFAVFEVSAKASRHAWLRQPPDVEEIVWDQLPDPMASRPEDRVERRAQLDALSHAISELTAHQREVFVAVALNDVPIDVVALRLGSNRNAVYKNLFDARHRLQATMAAAGYPVGDGSVSGGATGGWSADRSSRRRAAAMRLRCVIVDDSPAVLRAASALLEGEGIAVVGVAATGDDAVRLIDELEPDVTLVDIDLGPESGLDLARRLVGAPSRAGSPSILISTHDAADFAKLIEASPAIGFLPKSELSADAIRRLLAEAHAEGRD